MSDFYCRFQSRLVCNVATVKDYGGIQTRLTVNKVLKNPDLPAPPHRPKGTVNQIKTEDNIQRAKSKVYEYAYCNDWEWFVTLTIAPDKENRYDIDAFRKKLSQWIRDKRKSTGFDVKYLLIPEQHEDKAWHLHGFLLGLPVAALHKFTLAEKLPYRLRERLKQGVEVYDWTAYSKRFGYTTIERIQNRQACAAYVTKYITKDLARSVTEVNAHLYYCSQGLQRAEIIKRGLLLAEPSSWDFENVFAKCKTFSKSSAESVANFFID